jgi:hypothetical protein
MMLIIVPFVLAADPVEPPADLAPEVQAVVDAARDFARETAATADMATCTAHYIHDLTVAPRSWVSPGIDAYCAADAPESFLIARAATPRVSK